MRHGGPRLAAARPSWPAAQLGCWASLFDQCVLQSFWSSIVNISTGNKSKKPYVKYFIKSMILAFCATEAFAAWDYSITAKIAIYESSKDACLPIDEDIVNRGYMSIRHEMQKMSKNEVEAVKNTEEYKILYQEGVDGYRELIKATPANKKKGICKVIMGVDGNHL